MNLELDRMLLIAVENLGTTLLDQIPGEGLGGGWWLAFCITGAG